MERLDNRSPDIGSSDRPEEEGSLSLPDRRRWTRWNSGRDDLDVQTEEVGVESPTGHFWRRDTVIRCPRRGRRPSDRSFPSSIRFEFRPPMDPACHLLLGESEGLVAREANGEGEAAVVGHSQGITTRLARMCSAIAQPSIIRVHRSITVAGTARRTISRNGVW